MQKALESKKLTRLRWEEGCLEYTTPLPPTVGGGRHTPKHHHSINGYANKDTGFAVAFRVEHYLGSTVPSGGNVLR